MGNPTPRSGTPRRRGPDKGLKENVIWCHDACPACHVVSSKPLTPVYGNPSLARRHPWFSKMKEFFTSQQGWFECAISNSLSVMPMLYTEAKGPWRPTKCQPRNTTATSISCGPRWLHPLHLVPGNKEMYEITRWICLLNLPQTSWEEPALAQGHNQKWLACPYRRDASYPCSKNGCVQNQSFKTKDPEQSSIPNDNAHNIHNMLLFVAEFCF